MEKKTKIKYFLIAFAISIFFILLDQATKLIFEQLLIKNGYEIIFLDEFINFRLVYNTGAGWGILSGKKFILVSMSAIMSCVLGYVLYRVADFKKGKFITWTVAVLLAGTFGNLIDRAFYPNGVIDFIQFDFWPLKEFPTFNIADSCLTIGAVLLVIYVIFIYKEPEQVKKDNKPEEMDKDNNA